MPSAPRFNLPPNATDSAEQTPLRPLTRLWPYAALLLALVLAVVFWQAARPQTQILLIDAKQQPVMQLDVHGDYLSVHLQQNVLTPVDRDLELWAVKGNGAAVSLGLIPKSNDRMIGLNREQRISLTQAQHLTVILETRGGSDSGVPEGPSLYTSVVNSL